MYDAYTRIFAADIIKLQIISQNIGSVVLDHNLEFTGATIMYILLYKLHTMIYISRNITICEGEMIY